MATSHSLHQINPDEAFPALTTLDPTALTSLVALAHQGRLSIAVGQGVANELRNVAQLIGMLRDSLKFEMEGTPAELLEAANLAAASLVRQIGVLERQAPLEPRPTSVHLNELIERVVELIRKDRRAARASFQVDLPRDLPAVVAVESDLEELLWELLSNAKAASARSGQVTIRLQARTGVGEVILSVEDDGPGISETGQQQLFSVEKLTVDRRSVRGIGLAAAQRLAQLNGAELEVDLEVATGARFLIRLPVSHPGSTSLPILI